MITVRQKEELSAYYMGERFFLFLPPPTEIVSISPPEHRQTGQAAKNWLEASPEGVSNFQAASDAPQLNRKI